MAPPPSVAVDPRPTESSLKTQRQDDHHTVEKQHTESECVFNYTVSVSICQYLSVPQELMDACFTEGTSQQGKLHLAGVDGSHGWVTKTTDAHGGLQLHLGSGLGPEPPVDDNAGHKTHPQSIIIITMMIIMAHPYPHIFFLYLSANFAITSR